MIHVSHSFCLSVYLSIYLSIYLSVYRSLTWTIHASCIHESLSLTWVSEVPHMGEDSHMNESYLSYILSVCLSIYLSIYQSVCLSVSNINDPCLLYECEHVSHMSQWSLPYEWGLPSEWFMSLRHSIYLSIYLSICLSIYLSVYLSLTWTIHASCMNASISLTWGSEVPHMGEDSDIHESYLSFILSVCRSIYLCIYLSVCLFVCLWHEWSMALVWMRASPSHEGVRSLIVWGPSYSWVISLIHSIYLSIYLSICLSIYLSVYLSLTWTVHASCMNASISLTWGSEVPHMGEDSHIHESYLSFILSVCRSIYLSTHLSVYLSLTRMIHGSCMNRHVSHL